MRSFFYFNLIGWMMCMPHFIWWVKLIISIGTYIFVDFSPFFVLCVWFWDYIFDIGYGCIDVVGFCNDNSCMGVVEYDTEYKGFL